MGYTLLKFFTAPFIKLFWLGKLSGLRNVPKQGSFIVASNHKSYLDFILLFAILPRKVSFLAGEVFFKKRFWRPIMKITEQIRVDRDMANKSSLYEKVSILFQKGGALGIFPEGTRSRDGKLHKGYNGAVKFACKYKIPIIPVGISGAFEAWAPHMKSPKLKKIDVNIGEKFLVKTEHYNQETEALMNRIANLANEEYHE